jgi:hypothetical protein
MKSLFDKDFFKFTIGFVLLIIASFAVMAFSGMYQATIDASAGNIQPIDTP